MLRRPLLGLNHASLHAAATMDATWRLRCGQYPLAHARACRGGCSRCLIHRIFDSEECFCLCGFQLTSASNVSALALTGAFQTIKMVSLSLCLSSSLLRAQTRLEVTRRTLLCPFELPRFKYASVLLPVTSLNSTLHELNAKTLVLALRRRGGGNFPENHSPTTLPRRDRSQ